MRHTKILSAVLVLLTALVFSCSTDDSSDSSSFDSPAAVVRGAAQSGDLSSSGVSKAIATTVNDTNKDGSVEYMLGTYEGGSALIFDILGKIADKGYLSGAGFNTALSLNFTEVSGIEVQRLQIDGSSGGSVFYIYSSGKSNGQNFKFILKCTENSYGSLDTDLYWPAQYTEMVQIKKTSSGKTKFLYRVNSSETDKEDYYRTSFSSSGTIEGYLYQTAGGGIKSTLVSDRSYTGVYQVVPESAQVNLILLNASGTVVASKQGDGAWAGDDTLRTRYAGLINRAQSLQSSFPSMSKPSELNELRTKLESWN